MKMTRWLFLILLTLFQDSFVRFGTLLGLAAGYGSLQVIGGEPWINMSAYGFIGWGVGAYLGHHRLGKTPESRPPKLKVHQGGRLGFKHTTEIKLSCQWQKWNSRWAPVQQE